MKSAKDWEEYELLDTSDGERLERWGKYTVIRPDPQVLWNNCRQSSQWKNADAVYKRSKTGGGAWSENKLPDKWTIGYKGLTFQINPMGFKHMGLFPEQAANWDTITSLIKGADREISVLNLFAYTGGATVAAAKAGAKVCHVDASKGMVARAKENASLSGLQDANIRYIVDDCKKFCEREIRRGKKYDAVIMDPPSYGRGPSGELWKLEDDIDDLIKLVATLMSENPLFFQVNSYTTGLSPSTMGYILNKTLKKKYCGQVISDEIGIPVTSTGASLPCGSFSFWVADGAKYI